MLLTLLAIFLVVALFILLIPPLRQAVGVLIAFVVLWTYPVWLLLGAVALVLLTVATTLALLR